MNRTNDLDDSTHSQLEVSSSEGSVVSSSEEVILPPLLGFGTFNSFTDHDRVAAAVKEAIKCGYRHFDLAKLYENEVEIGKAIAECIKEGIVTREELYLCTKLWCDDHGVNDIEDALTGTLKRLGVDYVDNYMMHWPTQWKKGTGVRVAGEHGGDFDFEVIHVCDNEAIATTWRAMEDLVRKGLAKSIGVSNFDHIQLQALLDTCDIKPLTNEVEMHPYLAQNDLLEFCQSNAIHVVAYSPLGKPGYKNPEDPNLLEDPVIVSIAESISRTPAQVLLRWNIQRGVSVVPKSLTPSRIADNANVFDWRLTDEMMASIGELDRHFRFVHVPWFDFSLYDERRFQVAEKVAHHFLPTQPLCKEGSRDERDVYINSFGRDGKPLHTDIFMKRGVIKNLHEYARELVPELSWDATNYVITDEIVSEVLKVEENVVGGMKRAGIECHLITVPAQDEDESGQCSVEPFKTTTVLNTCIDQILASGITKHSCIISVGGGVVNNLCGVIASMLYRGIGLVHITTSTMGMMDAALDFKQAVNHCRGKNLLGCYYPASKVVIDPDCVSSLSHRHVLNGIAEALKHALCQSQEMVDAIVQPVKERGQEEAYGDSEYIEKICKDCIEIKVPTLDHYHNSDFNEMAPQYGHAVGHAVESLSWNGNSPLLHGEAVAVGMCVSAEIAYLKGICTEREVEVHYDVCNTLGLPAYVPENLCVDDILYKMTYDKHFVKSPSMGLVRRIGEMAAHEEGEQRGTFTFQISNTELKQAMDANVVRRRLHLQNHQ